MGLDVWVVKMEHVDSPKEPVQGFLDALIMEGFDHTWGGVVGLQPSLWTTSAGVLGELYTDTLGGRPKRDNPKDSIA